MKLCKNKLIGYGFVDFYRMWHLYWVAVILALEVPLLHREGKKCFVLEKTVSSLKQERFGV